MDSLLDGVSMKTLLEVFAVAVSLAFAVISYGDAIPCGAASIRHECVTPFRCLLTAHLTFKGWTVGPCSSVHFSSFTLDEGRWPSGVKKLPYFEALSCIDTPR
jgi:hypothetical protein